MAHRKYNSLCRLVRSPALHCWCRQKREFEIVVSNQDSLLKLTADLRICIRNKGVLPTTLRALNSAVECHLHTVEVIGSNPIAPTILLKKNQLP
jgi:hypothetical protein